jgi:hypothetical protein
MNVFNIKSAQTIYRIIDKKPEIKNNEFKIEITFNRNELCII